MAKSLERPDWYREEFYNKNRTPEEWLYEIHKRNKLASDKLNWPVSFWALSIEAQRELFLKIVFADDIDVFLSNLQPTPFQPLKPLSVSDVFRMHMLITNSDWYKNHPKKELFERAIFAITNEQMLSIQESAAFSEFFETPWHSFHENSLDENWYPRKDIIHLSGNPMSLNINASKEDIRLLLNHYLAQWLPKKKLQDVELRFPSWQESKILAVADLKLWFRILGQDYDNIDLHKMLWPKDRISQITGERVNPYDDIDRILNEVERVFNDSTVCTLLNLCEQQKFKYPNS